MGNWRDDIVLNGDTLPLFLDFAEGTDTPETVQDQFTDDDLVEQANTWHLGAGYSQDFIPGTYAYAENGDGRWPRVFLPGPQMNSVTLSSADTYARWAMDLNGHTYLGGGKHAYRMPNGAASSATMGSTHDFGAGVNSWSARTFLGKGYVGCENSSNEPLPIRQVTASSGWETGSTGCNARSLETAFYSTANGYRLFMQDGKNTLKTAAADPLSSSNHGTPITIGDSGVLVNRLAGNNGHVYAATDHGLFDFDGQSGAAPNLTPDLALQRDSENGVAAHAGDGFVYYGHKHGLTMYQADGFDAGRHWDVSFGRGLPNETPIRGQVTATAQDGGWVAQAVWNGTDTYVCWGRHIRANEGSIGPSPMLWHGAPIKITGQRCYLLHISGATNPPRLWVGNGNNVQWCLLPRTEHPLGDSDYQYATSYTVYIPALTWGLPGTRKNFLRMDCEGDNLGVGASIQWSYNVDGSAYAVLGTVNSNPTLRPGTEIIGRRIAWKAVGSGQATTPAAMRSTVFRSAQRITVRDTREYQVDLSPWKTDNMGNTRSRDPYTVLERLRRLSQQGQVTLRDEAGDTLTVLVHPPIRRKVVKVKGAGAPADGRNALVALIRLTVLQRLGSGFRWGDGTTYGSGKVYGGTL